jgi:hypothetical protein
VTTVSIVIVPTCRLLRPTIFRTGKKITSVSYSYQKRGAYGSNAVTSESVLPTDISCLTKLPSHPFLEFQITSFSKFHKLYYYCCYLLSFICLTGTYKWKITDVVITFVLQEVLIKL